MLSSTKSTYHVNEWSKEYFLSNKTPSLAAIFTKRLSEALNLELFFEFD